MPVHIGFVKQSAYAFQGCGPGYAMTSVISMRQHHTREGSNSEKLLIDATADIKCLHRKRNCCPLSRYALNHELEKFSLTVSSRWKGLALR